MSKSAPKSKTDTPRIANAIPSTSPSSIDFPPSEQTSPSARALRVAREMANWGDTLLTLVTDVGVGIPITDDERVVLGAILRELTSGLRDFYVGFSIDGDDGARHVLGRTGGESTPMTSDRVFPSAPYERTEAIAFGALRPVLHVASEDSSIVDESSVLAEMAKKTGRVVSIVLAHSRAHAEKKRLEVDRAAIQENLSQVEKLAAFGQLAAGIVHELNNPLTSILAYSDYLLKKAHARGADGDPDDFERLRRVNESANRVLDFTRGLVNYARPTSGESVPVSLPSLVAQAVSYCDHLVDASHAELTHTIDDDATVIRAVPQEIVQVIVNLVTNACHALPPEGGKISIRAQSVPKSPVDGVARVRIVVRDNGHGIAKENLPHVFTPFFTTKGEGRGTGLGLAIVRGIVERGDGEISVESEHGNGTTIVLTLPAHG
ncbi:MAG: HAMP domain-containing sensor histidine kinase [Polyangiaceae bacterium]